MDFAREAWSSPVDPEADATHRSVLPNPVDDRLVVQCAAHVPGVLPGVDIDDVPTTTSAAARVITAVDRLVPVPAGIEEFGRDVPVTDQRTTTPVASNAVHPITTARDVYTILRWAKERVTERAPIGRSRRAWGNGKSHNRRDSCQKRHQRQLVLSQSLSPLSG